MSPICREGLPRAVDVTHLQGGTPKGCGCHPSAGITQGPWMSPICREGLTICHHFLCTELLRIGGTVPGNLLMSDARSAMALKQVFKELKM